MDIRKTMGEILNRVLGYEEQDLQEIWSNNLWEEDLIDSLGFVTLISQIENAFSIQIDLRSLDPQSIASFAAIEALVASKM